MPRGARLNLYRGPLKDLHQLSANHLWLRGSPISLQEHRPKDFSARPSLAGEAPTHYCVGTARRTFTRYQQATSGCEALISQGQ